MGKQKNFIGDILEIAQVVPPITNSDKGCGTVLSKRSLMELWDLSITWPVLLHISDPYILV